MSVTAPVPSSTALTDTATLIPEADCLKKVPEVPPRDEAELTETAPTLLRSIPAAFDTARRTPSLNASVLASSKETPTTAKKNRATTEVGEAVGTAEEGLTLGSELGAGVVAAVGMELGSALGAGVVAAVGMELGAALGASVVISSVFSKVSHGFPS